MKSVFDQWYDENYQKHLKHHAAYWKCKQTWLAAQMQQLEEVNALRQRVAELESQLAKNNPLLDEAADALDKLNAERDALLEAATKAAEEIRKCDYTPARSTLLVAIASVKEKA